VICPSKFELLTLTPSNICHRALGAIDKGDSTLEYCSDHIAINSYHQKYQPAHRLIPIR
jgi:hypothetical protein